MFLNYSTGNNQLVGKVNANYIMLYGHLETRYNERIKRIFEVTGIENLQFDKMVQRAINVTENKYDKCMTKTDRKRRNLITSKIHFECEDGTEFIVDISLLVTGSKVLWHPEYPKTPIKQYRKLYENKDIQIDDNIFAFETLTSTIRLQNERTMNFTDYKSIDKFDIQPIVYKITKQELLYITEHMLKDKNNMISEKALKKIYKYRKHFGIKA